MARCELIMVRGFRGERNARLISAAEAQAAKRLLFLAPQVGFGVFVDFRGGDQLGWGKPEMFPMLVRG
jgi:hypothetical protein